MQATMLQDATRTGTYYRAILQNRPDFEGKIVMDVGSGSGILAFFAIQAGAAKVYCIEASPMAEVIREVAAANGWADKVVIINQILQDIRDEVPEKVDCITHETLGNFLFAERGIETVCVARERFLKPGGKLFPATAAFRLAPFEDAKTHQARMVKASNLWSCKDFYGVDLSSMEERSRREMFIRPLSDQFHPDQLRADALTRVYDFRTLRSEEVREFEIPLSFRSKSTCLMHGLAGWFDAFFDDGSVVKHIMSTSPWDTLTHWWMTRLMLMEPLAVNVGQEITGSLSFSACDGNTYKCKLLMESGGARRETESMDLAESDSAHRAPQHKTLQLTPYSKVQIVDWEATQATPTAAFPIVEDPLRTAKLAAKMQAASTESTSQKTATEVSSRDFGSQIKVAGVVYTFVDNPELCARLTGSSSSLVMVGLLGSSFLMAPAQQPGTCIVEFLASGTTPKTNCWLEQKEALAHMLDFLRQQHADGTPGVPMEEQLQAMSPQNLASSYAALKRARPSAKGVR